MKDQAALGTSRTRLTERFALLKKHNRPALVTFLTAGDPTFDCFQQILEGMPSAGADIIEIGVPFSDPMADGPSIQASSQRSLKHGTSIKDVLRAVEAFRKNEPDTPIILMGYYNPIYHYGVMEFARDAAVAGVDGVIVVDLPPEEADELLVHLKPHDLHMIFLATPTSTDERLPRILENASGFIYYVAVAGVTGTKSADEGAVKAAVARIRRHTQLPVAVGFGIKTPEQARVISGHSDAAVVGSAIVDLIAANVDADGKPKPGLSVRVLDFVKELATAVHGAWP